VTVDMAKSGPAVMAAADERKRRSNHLQAHDVKKTRLCSVPRTARARGRPANHLSHRINSTAGQATPLAGKAGVVSPPP
jgi:hypothetical protein